jgi:23S rRNA pseudouridine2605 synthase
VLGCESAGGEGANRWYAITARGASGKEIRQLFERQAAIVSRVLRTRLGTLSLERSLARGHYRELTHEEVQGLLAERPEESPAPVSTQPKDPRRRGSRRSPGAPVRRGRARD